MSQDPIGGVTSSLPGTLGTLLGEDSVLSSVLGTLQALGYDNVDLRTLGEDFERLPPPLQERLLNQDTGDIPPGQRQQLDRVFGQPVDGGARSNSDSGSNPTGTTSTSTSSPAGVPDAPVANQDVVVPGTVRGGEAQAQGFAATDGARTVASSLRGDPGVAQTPQAASQNAERASTPTAFASPQAGPAGTTTPGAAIPTNARLDPGFVQQGIPTQTATALQGLETLPPALAAQVGGFTQALNPLAQQGQQVALVAPGNPSATQPATAHPLPTDSVIVPAGHTGEGVLRRDARTARRNPGQGQPLPSRTLTPWDKRINEETRLRTRARAGSQWIYWLLIVVAYGGLAIAIIALAAGGRAGFVDPLGHPAFGGYALLASVVAAITCWLFGRRLAGADKVEAQ